MVLSEGCFRALDPAVANRYSRALDSILKQSADLKDDTYIQHLLTETESRVNTEHEIKNCGIFRFIESVLAGALEALELTTLALNLSRIVLLKLESAPSILDLVEQKIEDLCQYDDQSLISALLNLIQSILNKNKSPSLSEQFVKIATKRKFLEKIFENLQSPVSYHISDLSIKCFISILTVLSQIKQDEKSANYKKIRQNLLVEYFENTKENKLLLAQLKQMVKQVKVCELKTELFEFVKCKLDYSMISFGARDFCFILLESGLDNGDIEETARKLVRVEDPTVRLTACVEITRILPRAPDLVTHVTDYLNLVGTGPDFIRFISKPNIGDNISSNPHIRRTCLEGCVKVLKEEESENIRNTLAVLTFIQGISNYKDFECLEDILKFIRTTLGRFMGVPDNLKSCCCQTLSSLVQHDVISGQAALEFLSSLGYSCVSDAGSWQLKDSALQCLCIILKSCLPVLTSEQHSSIQNIINSTQKDYNSYIRSGSYQLWSSLLNLQADLNEDDQQFIYSRVEKTLLTDEEAIVRRDCVDFFSSVVFLLTSGELEQKLSNLLIHVLSKDFDWEVKLKTASVWTKIFTKHKQDSDRNESLQNCGFFNGLILGLTDYEGSVRGRFEELLEELEDDLNLREEHCLNKIQKLDIAALNSRKSVPNKSVPNFEEDDVDDIIERIVEAEDSDLVAELHTSAVCTDTKIVNFSKKSFADFLIFYRGRRLGTGAEEEDVLDSILEDIINSTDNKGLVEIVDCY